MTADKEVRVVADDASVSFIEDRGGSLYVWSSDAGIEHETTKPHDGVSFVTLRGEGFELHVDSTIEMPHLWRLVFHRFPTPHVRALWNGAAYSGARYQSWEGSPGGGLKQD